MFNAVAEAGGVNVTSQLDNASKSTHLVATSSSSHHKLQSRRSASSSYSMSPTAAPVAAAMPILPFPGAFCGLSSSQFAPLQMYPPYIFMGFPLHPQLLQSYPAVPTVTHPPTNPAKRKLTSPPPCSPTHEKQYRTPLPTTPAALHPVAYVPLLTTPDPKHLVMTSPVPSGDSHQGAPELDQDGVLDLSTKRQWNKST